MDTNFLVEASRQQGRSAMVPLDTGMSTDCTTSMTGYQGINARGATGPAVRLGPKIASRLETGVHSKCRPMFRHDHNLRLILWKLGLLAQWDI
jgi:hypothetical protein